MEKGKMKKGNSNLFLAVLITVVGWEGMVFGFAGGDGSESNPWQISNATHLQAVNNNLYAHYILVNDINAFPGIFTHAVIAPYLGASSPHFQGSFDGNGHVIRNLTVNGGESHYGLFGRCGSGSEIKNLYMENISINGWLFVGCIAGYNNGAITNCHVIGDIYGPSNVYTDVDQVGGIVGRNDGNGKITDCSSAGTITCPLRSIYNNNEYVGGLVGYNNYGSVTNCHSTMNITASAFGGYNIGGLIGQNIHGTITSCYASGDVAGNAFVGGLIGQNVGANISLCYSTGKVSGIAATYGDINYYSDYTGGLVGINNGNITDCYSTGNTSGDHFVGGLIGQNYNGGHVTNCYSTGRASGSSDTAAALVGYNQDSYITSCFWDKNTSNSNTGCNTNVPSQVVDVFGKTTTEMQTQSTFTDYGWDFVGEILNGTEDIWEMVDYPKLDWENDLDGDGTSESPYLIQEFEDFQELCKNQKYWEMGVHTRLDCDLDLNPTLPGRIIYTQSPIAPDTDNLTSGFQGTDYKGYFNGNGHVISNLTIASPTQDYIGLFGYLGSGIDIAPGQIKNLGVENIDITGYQNVGGLVGCIGNGSETITCCYTTGTVSGFYYVGGLAGYNSLGSITACYTMGTVSGGNNYVGGLVGSNSGIITACYATGSVSGSTSVGGLAGQNYSGTIISCYATGSVSGANSVGGLVGINLYTIISSFWNIETSGQTFSAGGKGLTTAQMKTMSIYQNADWADKGWVMNDGADYPRLNWENTSGVPIPLPQAIPLVGSGTAEDPYLISTPQEFALLSWYSDVLNKHIRLVDNLDLSGLTLYPIGDSYGLFTGVFDGNGYTVSNAAILQPQISYLGLFSTLDSGGQIKNLGAENINISGYFSVGGLVARNIGTITSCYATGSVNGRSYVGGLVGDNGGGGTITSCYATSSVSGSNYVGGLAGGHLSGIISACYATGTVSGGAPVGGLVGQIISGSITTCYATGTVSGFQYVGGLAGRNYGTITASFWDIETSGTTDGVGNQDPDPSGVTGLPTVDMQTRSTYTSAGWDFTDEILNGANDIWRMCIDGVDYPHLNWESPKGDFACPDGVNVEDLDFYAVRWLMEGCASSNNYCGGVDLDYSGVVNMADLAIFAGHWLSE